MAGEIARRLIGPVIQLCYGFHDAFPRCRSDIGFTIDNTRYGLDGYAGKIGNVKDCGLG